MTAAALAPALAAALLAGSPQAPAAPVRRAAQPAARDPRQVPLATPRPRSTPSLATPMPQGHGGDTRCDACHVAEGWDKVQFAHERTGFPLEGRHRQVACRACHPENFSIKVASMCSGCHRDAHLGEFGAQCGSCHDASTWYTNFTADSHRRTNFPLSGRHAMIPCQECHRDQRDRVFSRTTATCFDCHEADYVRAATISIDHVAAGFGRDCRQCHNSQRFAGAFFPAHDTCFQITAGPHAGIPCLNCHTRLAGTTVTGACNTGTAVCSSCHQCARHPSVPGFECVERKCYECHLFTTNRPLQNLLRRTR